MRRSISIFAPVLATFVLSASAFAVTPVASVKLNPWTNASAGTAGTSTVYLTGSGFPSKPAVGSATISIATACFGTPSAVTTNTTSALILGSTYRVGFLIPKTLASQNYFVSITGPGYASTNCSEVTVQAPLIFSGSCLPTSSLGVSVNAAAKTVVSYVPNGWWGAIATGVQVVPIEVPATPLPPPVTVPTPGVVNSCSANPVTGQAVCSENGNTVDVIGASPAYALTTLTDGATAGLGFSGGGCSTCGVAVNSATNQAVFAVGNAGNSGGLQFLDLGTNTFGPLLALTQEDSENIAFDTTRGLITSPNEFGNYDLIKVGPGGTITEYTNFVTDTPAVNVSTGTPVSAGTLAGELDSAAEDCTTGILLSTAEFTSNLYIADLTQATFTAGTPGSWTAPQSAQNFSPDFDGLGAGTSGISVPPGSHVAVVTGEFGGNLFGVVKLPTSSGAGTPAFGDYVAATMPGTPDGCDFGNGFDPHTVTAYTSPNTGKAYGLLASWAPGVPSYLGIVDLAALLAAPRSPLTHTVDPTYDLVANGVVTYVPTGNATCGGGGGVVGGDIPTSARGRRVRPESHPGALPAPKQPRLEPRH